MLTSHQCETVAIVSNGGIICLDCAKSEHGELAINALEEGLEEFVPQDVSALIRYSLDEYVSENAAERASEDIDYDVDPEGWQKAFDEACDEYPCDSCGRDIS